MARIDRSGKHLLGLINDVLDLSKIEAGQLELGLADYSLAEVVHAVVTQVESLAAEKGLILQVAVAPDLPAGRGDERRLAQVLLNLVGNAIKFTEIGSVRIAALPGRRRVRRVRRRHGTGDRRGGPAADLRGVPAGGQLEHAEEGRDGARALHRASGSSSSTAAGSGWSRRSGAGRPSASGFPCASSARSARA